jgi:hypothetical protein
MATAGVSIASAAAAEAGTTVATTAAPAETADTHMRRIDVVQRQHAPPTTAAPMRPLRIIERLIARPTPKQLMVAANITRLRQTYLAV